MQCLTWASSKPHGIQQERFSSTALWSRSWPQQLPPPCQAPLGAAGSAGLRPQSTSAMGFSAKGASRAETAEAGRSSKGGKAGGCHLPSQKQHRYLSFLSLPAQPPGSSSAGLPWDISLALGTIKPSVAPWSLLYSPRSATARMEPGRAALPRAVPVPRAHSQAWHESKGAVGSLWQDPRFNCLSYPRLGKSIRREG